MTTLSHDEARTVIDGMTNAQLFRVMTRMRWHQAAFHDVRDAIAQAAADELDSIATNCPRARQPDDPGSEYPEPDVGHYPGWIVLVGWLAPTAAFWAIAYALVFR